MTVVGVSVYGFRGFADVGASRAGMMTMVLDGDRLFGVGDGPRYFSWSTVDLWRKREGVPSKLAPVVFYDTVWSFSCHVTSRRTRLLGDCASLERFIIIVYASYCTAYVFDEY